MSRRGLSVVGVVLALTFLAVAAGGILHRNRPSELLPTVAAVFTDFRQTDIAVFHQSHNELLTNDKRSFGPVWSPNRTQIAFPLDNCPGSDWAPPS